MSAPHRITLTCASDTARERLALLDACIGPNWGFRKDVTDGGGPLFRALCTPSSVTITTLNLCQCEFAEQQLPLLCRALEHMPALLELNLSCEIGFNRPTSNRLTHRHRTWRRWTDSHRTGISVPPQSSRTQVVSFELCRSIESFANQHQIAGLVLLGSERWHLSSSTCHHCSCSICHVRAVFVSHHIIRATGNRMGALSEAGLQKLPMHALELRHLQQLSVLDLYGADCVNAMSE